MKSAFNFDWIGRAVIAAVIFQFCSMATPIQAGPLETVGELKPLALEFKFTEGPAADKEGNVYFTDQPNDRIMRWSVDGKLSTFKQPAGRSNGLCFDADGNLWACADGRNELWKIKPSGEVEVVLRDYEGKLFNGPNDLWIDAEGGIYFTDPFYKREYWNRGASEMQQAIYFLPRGSRRATRLPPTFKQPNGIISTKDGKTLYVADIGEGKTYKFAIEKPGVLGEKTLFCGQGSDGMTIDEQGNVYLTGKGVAVYDAAGTKIKQIDVPEPWTANVCFGGKDRKTLFITAGRGFYSIGMNVAGPGSQ
jgi:gluconolactonase